jgi:hypothetical protein
MKRTLPLACLTAGLLLLPVLADAQPQPPPAKPKVLLKPGAAPTAQPPAATPPATPPPATPAPAADAGVKEKGKEDAAQKKRRKDHMDLITRELRAVVKQDGVITNEEKDLIRTYWRRSMRAFRIRLLAEDEKDTATVARADAYLAKIEKTLFDRLKELQKKPAAKAADGGAK